jgi:hypothetical protein
MGLKSKTVKVHQAGKADQGQTIKPIGFIHKLQIKLSVVNAVSEAVFTTLHFLRNLQMGLKSNTVKVHQAGKACLRQTLAYWVNL